MPIPQLPGRLIPRHSDEEIGLKTLVGRMCHLENDRFPGSQPVSFGAKDLAKLENQDYWVCEKSDGIRVLFLVVTSQTNEQNTYIIDRHNTYREISGIYFPHHENPMAPLRSSLVDGELVIDVDPRTQQKKTRFLAFDCLVIDDQNVMARSLDRRYGRLTEWFYKPYAKMIFDHPRVVEQQPFSIKVKEISFSYHVEKVFNVDIPALQHDNDGLIYTCVSTPYTPGTDSNILKWKPPSENSIDFKLILRFPPSRYDSTKPDFHARPLFLLHVWCGGEGANAKYEDYDDMYVTDDEWEELKRSAEQVDDRIVEVHWDPVLSRWRMMRFRNDKPNGNHITVVEKIIQSIAEGVEKETLLERSTAIRTAWKLRLGQSQQQNPQTQQQPPQATRVPLTVQQPRQLNPLPPAVEMRYGPFAQPLWSKVAGPLVISGMKR